MGISSLIVGATDVLYFAKTSIYRALDGFTGLGNKQLRE